MSDHLFRDGPDVLRSPYYDPELHQAGNEDEGRERDLAESLEDVDGDPDDEEELSDEERIDQLEAEVDELKSEISQLAATCARLTVTCAGLTALEGKVAGLEGVADVHRRVLQGVPEARDVLERIHAPEPPNA